jgi:AraC-like DNA-binding protein
MGPVSAPTFTLSVHYLRIIADQIRGLGADVGHWLARSGLGEASLGNAELAIPFSTFRSLVLDALVLTREPAFGLFVGQLLHANTHGILGYAAQSSGTVRQAVELFERFVELRISALSISTEVMPNDVRVLFHQVLPLGDVEGPVLEAVVMAIRNVVDTISIGAIRIGEVAFPFERPEYHELARDMLGCEVRWGQDWTGFTVAPEALDFSLRRADPAAYHEAALILERELERVSSNQSFSARVRRLLLERQSNFPSLQVTARLLQMTPRTLHRRLLDEGTSFRGLLEDVRHRLAVEHLSSGRFSIEEIAFTLGYADLANFRRAFKRWENVPPSKFRAAPRVTSKHRGGGPPRG